MSIINIKCQCNSFYIRSIRPKLRLVQSTRKDHCQKVSPIDKESNYYLNSDGIKSSEI